MSRLSRVGRRTYPWRADLTSIACYGQGIEPHLPLTYAELEQPDPANFPYEWRCPRCDVVGPSIFWDERVPVPPHDFIARRGEWKCRICLQDASDRMWHPEPVKAMFDPARVASLEPTITLSGWSVCMDETLGVLEAYVDSVSQHIATSRETFDILVSTDEAFDQFMEDMAFGAGADGMRFLHGIKIYEKAVRAYRKATHQDVVAGKDEITLLSEAAHSLATQAASVGYAGDPVQQEILIGRYLAARQRSDRLRERLAVLDAELDMAAIAVIA